ncbi:MAG: FkbM family methyltransferase [Phascolarctobacterium sp.]|nr:FkbM family methyltransferase [Phascolarctobacterium sp.]
MLDFIKEKVSVWERLLQTEKHIVLYGMGNGADKIVDWCEANSVKISGIFASDEFVRYQSFRGMTVQKYSDIIEQFGEDILVVIAFASERPEVLARFKELAEAHETLAPHLPLFDEPETVSLAWLEKYEAELQEVYKKLADDVSRKTFAAVLNYKLSGKVQYLFDCDTAREEDLRQIFTFGENEVYMDLGAYNGDTVQEFLNLVDGKYQHIIAVEPDRRNCKKLTALAEQLGEITVHQCGVWDEAGELGFSDSGGRQSTFLAVQKKTVPVNSIDNLAEGKAVSYIKMDVEGAEVQALRGGEAVIKEYAPKMFIAAYHYDVDVFRLPLQIWQLVPEYKIFFRKHPYVPAWELNFLIIK